MKSKQRKYVLENHNKKSVQNIAKELRVTERSIQRFLEKHRQNVKEVNKPSLFDQLWGDQKDWIFKTLLVVLGLGFLLRVAGIFWGTPLFDPLATFYHGDESKIVNGAVGFPQNILTNIQFTYTTFYPHMIGILSLPLRMIFGQESLQYYLYTHLLGRLCSVLVGAGTILATYFMVKEIYGRKRALLAATFISFSMYHVQNSAWTTVDVMTSLWAVFFFMAVRKAILTSGTMKDYIWAGVIFGCSIGTKQSCAILIVLFLVMYVYSIIQKLPGERKGIYVAGQIFNPKLFVFGGVTMIAFFVTTPGFLIKFHEFIDWTRYVAWENYRYYLPRTNLSVWGKFLQKFSDSVGIPIALLFCFGSFVALRTRKVEIIAVLLLFVAYFLYLGSMIRARYVIVIMPFIAAIASHGVISLYEQKQKIVRVIAGVVIVGTVVYSFFYSASAVYLRFNDPRMQAAHYIQENIPLGTTIGIGSASEQFRWNYHAWRYPKVDFRKYKEVYFIERPDILVISSADFVPIEETLNSDKLKAGYILEEKYKKEWYRYSSPTPRVFKFYEDLLNDRAGYVLLRSFKKNNFVPIELRPPEIRIYRRI